LKKRSKRSRLYGMTGMTVYINKKEVELIVGKESG
jgi:hypothetical protein